MNEFMLNSTENTNRKQQQQVNVALAVVPGNSEEGNGRAAAGNDDDDDDGGNANGNGYGSRMMHKQYGAQSQGRSCHRITLLAYFHSFHFNVKVCRVRGTMRVEELWNA
ncbi:uncharacterized protein DMAD_02798 [Drosophila madeirensis]|uniref:Uncharacterized protein n=1 Tax=Drosophila madeirensis TaxID=30013 RepID=A0AAU9G796_DROMD